MLRPFPFLDIFFDDLEKFVYETDLFRELNLSNSESHCLLFLKIVAELNFREEADSQTIEHQRRADRPNRSPARIVRRFPC